MAKKSDIPKTKIRLANAGKRKAAQGSKLLDLFYVVDKDGNVAEPEDRRAYELIARERCVIGFIYEIPEDKDGSLYFGHREHVGEVSEHLLAEWSATSAAVVAEKEDETARKRVTEEHRTAWLALLEPIRTAYKRAPRGQRRAMRQLLLEWLER